MSTCGATPAAGTSTSPRSSTSWGIYQQMIAAYRHPDPAAGRELMVKLIESLSAGVPRPLVEIAKLARTLSKRAADVLAYLDRPGTSNGPTEAICECGGWLVWDWLVRMVPVALPGV